ncbi:MAG: hypothetical protein E7426_05725 [Ruminococcaceae bacterium]|jgi:major membrane immunogen (membrane-anchored lipoprotein)|nr:hypothetical protein [Oscillospiraceae bacterium]
MAKSEKLVQFYAQCQEKGYTDMSDEAQSLKAKVIASDLKLPIGNIAELYRSAEEAFRQDQADKERAAQAAAAEEARRAVDGELLMTLGGSISGSKDYKTKEMKVYRRPDNSVYVLIGDGQKKIERVNISVEKGATLSYEYHPSKLVYTGASSGGISMGGFHQTEAYSTEHVHMSGKGDIVAIAGDGTKMKLDYADLEPEVRKAFRRDDNYVPLTDGGKSTRILCYDYAGQQHGRDLMKYSMSGGYNYQKAMTAGSQAADARRLPMGKCNNIANLLNQIIRHDYPPTDAEYYAQAEKLVQANTSDQVKRGKQLFTLISDYQDAQSRADAANARYEELLQAEKEQKVLEREEAARNRKKFIKIAAPVAAALLVIIILAVTVIIPNANYGKAVKLLEGGQYTEAATAFLELDGKKDSTVMALQEVPYQAAKAAIDAADKGDASLLEKVDGLAGQLSKLYKSANASLNSDGQKSAETPADKSAEASEAPTETAADSLTEDDFVIFDDGTSLLSYIGLGKLKSVELFTPGNDEVIRQYNAASRLLKLCGDYKDSAALAERVTGGKAAREQALQADGYEEGYQQALAYAQSGDMENAVSYLMALGSYKDSREQLVALVGAAASEKAVNDLKSRDEGEQFYANLALGALGKLGYSDQATDEYAALQKAWKAFENYDIGPALEVVENNKLLPFSEELTEAIRRSEPFCGDWVLEDGDGKILSYLDGHDGDSAVEQKKLTVKFMAEPFAQPLFYTSALYTSGHHSVPEFEMEYVEEDNAYVQTHYAYGNMTFTLTEDGKLQIDFTGRGSIEDAHATYVRAH